MFDETVIENRPQALFNFLWNEMQRHKDDVEQIAQVLRALEDK